MELGWSWALLLLAGTCAAGLLAIVLIPDGATEQREDQELCVAALEKERTAVERLRGTAPPDPWSSWGTGPSWSGCCRTC